MGAALVQTDAERADGGEALEPSESLTLREERIVCAVLESPTLGGAAAVLGLHRRTLERALARPHVAAALHARTDALAAESNRGLRQAAGEAVELLRRVMTATGEELRAVGYPKARDKIAAARTVLELVARAAERQSPAAQLEDLAAAEGLKLRRLLGE